MIFVYYTYIYGVHNYDLLSSIYVTTHRHILYTYTIHTHTSLVYIKIPTHILYCTYIHSYIYINTLYMFTYTCILIHI